MNGFCLNFILSPTKLKVNEKKRKKKYQRKSVNNIIPILFSGQRSYKCMIQKRLFKKTINIKIEKNNIKIREATRLKFRNTHTHKKREE